MNVNYGSGQDVKLLVEGEWFEGKINFVDNINAIIQVRFAVKVNGYYLWDVPRAAVGSQLMIIVPAEQQQERKSAKPETKQLEEGKIRLNLSNEFDDASSECEDTDGDDRTESDSEAGAFNSDAVDTDEYNNDGDENGNDMDLDPARVHKNTTLNENVTDQDEANNDDNSSWLKRGFDATIGRGYNYMKEKVSSEPAPPPKMKPQWHQKAIRDWNHEDVISWIESMESYAKFSSEFPQHIDGAALLNTEIDDLTLVITKKMWRRRFMKQLELAKNKYATADELDPNKYELETGDEEKHEINDKSAEVNGVVGLDNLGNTCYMNTSIQILSQTPYITRYLAKRAELHKKGPYPMLNAWTTLCNTIYNETKSRSYSGWRDYAVESPEIIRAALEEMDYEFASGEQDDSSRSLGYMLQGLDRDIEQEIIDQKKNKQNSNNVYKDEISIYHGRELDKAEKDNFIQELLRDHNPENSIIRKKFDGIEHTQIICLDCNKMYQAFSTFQMIDLALVSQEIELTNINIVYKDKYYKIPKISMLNYCSADLLVYHAIQHIQNDSNQKDKSKAYHAKVVVIESNGTIHDVSHHKLSNFKFENSSIFVLINEKAESRNKSGHVLQINLRLDGATSKISSIQYNPYNVEAVKQLATEQIESYSQESKDDDEDDEDYDYYAVYNNDVRSNEELEEKEKGFDAAHNDGGVNTLFVLRVIREDAEYCYDHAGYDLATEWEATEQFTGSSKLEALEKHQSKRVKVWEKRSKKKKYKTCDHGKRRREELDRIRKTLNILRAKNKILQVVNKFMENYTNTRYSMTGPQQLGDLDKCLNEYQKARILDNVSGSYSYPCPCKSGSEKSRWVKVQKEIVYAPAIFLFHLDRYGKRVTNSSTYNKPKSPKYHKGQKLKINYKNGKSYTAEIESINESGMHIKYIKDKIKEYIPRNQYWDKIPSYSRNINNSYSYKDYDYGSDKFDHDVEYGDTLKIKLNEASTSVYELYGVSNHSGNTKGGHYTATVKCLTNSEWYNISDSHVSKTYPRSATSHSASATILAYAQK